MTEGTDIATQLAKELSKNRELTKTLYTLRGEPPPNDHGCAPRPKRACGETRK